MFPIQNKEALVCLQSGFIYYLAETIKYTQQVKLTVSMGLKDIREI